MNIILNIIMWIAGAAGFIGIIGLIPCMVFGIIRLSKVSHETDEAKRKSLKKWGIVLLVSPWVLIFGGLVLLFAIRTLLN